MASLDMPHELKIGSLFGGPKAVVPQPYLSCNCGHLTFRHPSPPPLLSFSYLAWTKMSWLAL